MECEWIYFPLTKVVTVGMFYQWTNQEGRKRLTPNYVTLSPHLHMLGGSFCCPLLTTEGASWHATHLLWSCSLCSGPVQSCTEPPVVCLNYHTVLVYTPLCVHWVNIMVAILRWSSMSVVSSWDATHLWDVTPSNLLLCLLSPPPILLCVVRVQRFGC